MLRRRPEVDRIQRLILKMINSITFDVKRLYGLKKGQIIDINKKLCLRAYAHVHNSLINQLIDTKFLQSVFRPDCPV